MTPREAWDIIGCMPQWQISNTVKVLSLPTSQYQNTAEDNKRLEAAKICLTTKRPSN